MPTIHIVHHGSGQQICVRGIDMNLMPSASESEGGGGEEEELVLAGKNLQLSAISELNVHIKANEERDPNQMKNLSENLSNRDRDRLGKVSNQDRAWLGNLVSNRDQDWARKASNQDRDRDWLRTIVSNRDQELARKVSNEDRDWLGNASSRDEVQPAEVFDRNRPEMISEVIMGIYNERLRNGGEKSRGRCSVNEEEEIEIESQNVYGKIHHQMKVPNINENQSRNGAGNYHRLVSVADLMENREKDRIPNGNHHKFVPENDQDAERMGSEGNVSRGSDEELDMGGGIRKKLRLSKEQSALLEESFKEQSTLNPKQKNALARRLNLRARQVEVWFQNRRARTKLKKTEVDCELLKRCCESLTEENRRLQKEVAELRALKMMSDGPTTTTTTSSSAGGVAPANDFYRKPLPATTLRICAACEKPSPTHASLMPRKSPFSITINSMDMDMDIACPSLKTTPHFNLSMSPKQQSSAAIC